MPTGRFTTGKDQQLVIQTPLGSLQIQLTDFTANPKVGTLESTQMNGKTIHAYTPRGWDLSFKFDRFDNTADDYWAAFEAQYYAGVDQLPGTIFQTIRENDGSVSSYQFNGVVIKLDKAGDYAGDKKVDQSFSGMATERLKVT
jgi:hypothetical protein